MCSIGHARSTDIESASLEKRKTGNESGRVPEPLERRVMRKSARWPHTSFRKAPPILEEGKGGRHVTPTVTSATPPPRQFFSWSRQDSD